MLHTGWLKQLIHFLTVLAAEVQGQGELISGEASLLGCLLAVFSHSFPQSVASYFLPLPTGVGPDPYDLMKH